MVTTHAPWGNTRGSNLVFLTTEKTKFDPAPEIGVAVGFFDQSHFTKRFRKVTGMGED